MTAEDIQFRILPLVQMKEDGSPINISPIREICSRGLNSCPPEDRVIAWGLLSGLLPEQAEEWTEFREKISKEYKNFIIEFQIQNYENKYVPNCTGITNFGLPKNHIMELIHGDIIRTGHHIFKLSQCVDPLPISQSANSSNIHLTESNSSSHTKETDSFRNAISEENFIGDISTEYDENVSLVPYRMHMRRLERILYIFANLNQTLSYMQGFNEIVAILYYVASQCPKFFYDDWTELEAFVFFLFHRVINSTDLNELFTTQDHSSLIHKKLEKFMEVLEKHAFESAQIIKKMNIHPLQFCYRRMNLLFSQDQDIPNLLIIWDAIFAHFNELVEFEFYLIVSQIKIVEPLIDKDDYSQTMIALQKLNICDPNKLVDMSNQLWKVEHVKRHPKRDLHHAFSHDNIYEIQPDSPRKITHSASRGGNS